MDITTKLSGIQAYIMELLKTYRCLGERQIDRLAAMTFRDSVEFVKRHRTRLISINHHLLYKPDNGLLAMAGAKPDYDLIAAMDVMLEFRNQKIATYRPGKPPFKLVYVKETDDGRLRAYYVAVIHKGAEFIIPQQALAVIKGRKNAVIFLLDDIAQASSIDAPYEHYYAVAGKFGYRFYEGGEETS